MDKAEFEGLKIQIEIARSQVAIAKAKVAAIKELASAIRQLAPPDAIHWPFWQALTELLQKKARE